MNRELVIPNLHVILIHYPLGLFAIGLLIELGSFMWRRHAVRSAGQWMILLGGLSMIPASLSGAYALNDVALIGSRAAGGTWADTVAASPLTVEQWGELVWHVWLMSAATVLIVITIVVYLAASDRIRRKLHLPGMAMLLLGAGLMASGAWFAGEAIYRLGVGVEVTEAPAATMPATGRGAVEAVNTMLPPLQPHVIMAGFAVAVALAAVGLSIRTITREVPAKMDEVQALVESLGPPVGPVNLYAGRFWMATAFAMIATALLGWYFLGSEIETFSPKELWQIVADDSTGSKLNRRLAHVAVAGALVVLPLMMAALAKWAPRRKLLLGVMTVILLAAIGAQTWVGLLLLFDGPTGSIARFNQVGSTN